MADKNKIHGKTHGKKVSFAFEKSIFARKWPQELKTI